MVWVYVVEVKTRVLTISSPPSSSLLRKVFGIPECGLFMDEVTWDGSPFYTPLYAAIDAMQVREDGGRLNGTHRHR